MIIEHKRHGHLTIPRCTGQGGNRGARHAERTGSLTSSTSSSWPERTSWPQSPCPTPSPLPA